MDHSSTKTVTSTNKKKLPTAQGVKSAGRLLTERVVRTPLLESRLLNQQLQTRLLVKAECLQTTGSFKYRGALHRLLCLQAADPESAKRGVVAFSSGNFGQALAAAATSLNIPCCIVSPHDAPAIKLERIKAYGANLVLSEPSDPHTQNREVVASALANEMAITKEMTLLHPFEDIDVIHGQGTTGLELIQQAEQQLMGELALGDDDNEQQQNEWNLGAIVIPCGGGGLTAGICLAVEALNKQSLVSVLTIEPQGYDDHAYSFALPDRKRTSLAEIYPSSNDGINNDDDDHHQARHEITTTSAQPQKSKECDALMAGAPGHTTWSINASRLSGALTSIGDESVARAMRVAFEQFRLVLEPSGALALAAVLDGQIPLEPGRAVAIVASGGNTDWTTFARLMGMYHRP